MTCGHCQSQHQTNTILYPKNSLLKYEPPRLTLGHDLSDANYKKICRTTISSSFEPTSFYDKNLFLVDPYSNLCQPADVLDFLFPPLEYIDKYNHKYIICVSRHPATKSDIDNLEKNLNRRLKRSRALEVGLCNHRRQIYNEYFDELIRQITIECSERGIVLSRVRNAYRQTMKDYFNNYISANAYAMRTLLINEQCKTKLKDQIDHLEYEVEQLKNQLMNVEDYYDNILKLYSRLNPAHEYRYRSKNAVVPFELQQLRTANKLLKIELENVLLKKLKLSPIKKHEDEKIEHTKFD